MQGLDDQHLHGGADILVGADTACGGRGDKPGQRDKRSDDDKRLHNQQGGQAEFADTEPCAIQPLGRYIQQAKHPQRHICPRGIADHFTQKRAFDQAGDENN